MSYSVRVVDEKPFLRHYGKWAPLLERVLAELRQNPGRVVEVEFKEEVEARRFYWRAHTALSAKAKVSKLGKFVYVEKKM